MAFFVFYFVCCAKRLVPGCGLLQVGFRLGRHLSGIVPLFLGFIEKDFDDEDDAVANDLREICFQVCIRT